MEEINLSLEKCLVSKTGFTGDIVHNVCTGAQTFVPHGMVDYLLIIMAITMISACVVGALSLVSVLIYSAWRGW